MRIFLLFCQRCHSSFLLITSPSVPFSRVCMRIASGTCSAGESVFHNSMLTLKQKIVDILDTYIRWWQPWEDITSDGTVEVWISCYEHVRLHHVHTVQVLTQDRGQGHLPQLLQLVWEQEIILRIRCWNSFFSWHLPLVNADGGMLFSYQNLSPFFRIWNCWPRRHPNVGPTTAPDSGLSARPPTTRSISSWWV